MRAILLIAATVITWLYLQISIDSQNPCSAFSDSADCNSDRL